MPVLFFSVIAHEVAHGYAALKQGDDTALVSGRLTWNPIKHIDPFLTILLPLALAFAHAPILGGAKPVPVDPSKYRNLRRGDIIVSLAGVFTNLLIAIAAAILVIALGLIGQRANALEPSLGILQAMMLVGVELNLMLILFNLIPIPPLDGSHVVKYLLPRRLSILYQRFGRWGVALLIAVMYLRPSLLAVWLSPATRIINQLVNSVAPVILPTTTHMLFR